MSGNPISIQHQRHAPLLSEDTLQGPGTHRTSHRQTQALQTYRASMREDGAELRLIRRACSRLHLDQIRPHGLNAIQLTILLACANASSSLPKTMVCLSGKLAERIATRQPFFSEVKTNVQSLYFCTVR